MFPYMPVSVILKALVASFDLYMTFRQRRNFHSSATPSSRIRQLIPSSKIVKAQSYCHAKSTFQLIVGTLSTIIEAITTWCFLTPYLWNLSSSTSELRQTLKFLTLLTLFSTITDLPISIYSTFILEAKFGFNKTTVRTFIIDQFKNLFLSSVLGYPIVSMLYYVLKAVSKYDPLVVAFALWILGSLLMILMLWLVPSVIAPMFNTFTPMKEGSPVKERVENLAKDMKFPLSKIYVIDGSRRSSHSNAFIFGFFKKYICIYDTLLQQCGATSSIAKPSTNNDNDDTSSTTSTSTSTKQKEEEKDTGNGDDIVAVVCHELGHWHHGHLGKGVVRALVHTFIVCVLYAVTAGNISLFESFGFVLTGNAKMQPPVIIGMLLFNNMLSPLDDLLQPLHNYVSRKHEYEADAFAKSKGMQKPLGNALVTMSIDNLSNMNPDSLYSMWNYSHPTLIERLDALGVTPDIPKVKDGDGVKNKMMETEEFENDSITMTESDISNKKEL